MRGTDDPDPHRSAFAGRDDAFWDVSAPAVRAGRVARDPWVTRKAEDVRRGVTLLARPAPIVADTLGEVRDRLRAALTARGLGEALDGRYRLETAHATLVRFTSPLRDPARFVDALARARGRPFGTSVVAALELTLGDWYQSAEHSRLLATYTLPARTV